MDNAKLKEAGWEDIYLKTISSTVHIHHYNAGKNRKNILLIHTPVIAVKNCYECYEQLGRVYGFNVFALDYAPGEGECSGLVKDFTLQHMLDNLDAVYQYIKENYSNQIHLLGYTGAIFAQYYLGHNKEFKLSF